MGAGACVRMRELRLRQRGASTRLLAACNIETQTAGAQGFRRLPLRAQLAGTSLAALAMAFRATRLLRMRIDGSHQGNQMFGAPVSKTAYLDGSGPTFSAKKYVRPAPLRKLRPRSMPRHSLCAQGQ